LASLWIAATLAFASGRAAAGPSECSFFSLLENTSHDLALACNAFPDVACPHEPTTGVDWNGYCHPVPYPGGGLNESCGPQLRGEVEGTLRLAIEETPVGPPAACAGDPQCIDLALTLRLELDGTSPTASTVDLSGDVLAIGDPSADRSSDEFEDYGAVYAYRRNGSIWEFEGQLEDPGGQPGHNFGASLDVSGGHSVDVSGALALVGAPWTDAGGAQRGVVRAFRFDGAAWQPDAALASPHSIRTTIGQFGWSVRVSGDHVLAGGAQGFASYSTFFEWPTARLDVEGTASGGDVRVEVGAHVRRRTGAVGRGVRGKSNVSAVKRAALGVCTRRARVWPQERPS
jgi:hypothetical protein